MSLVELLKQKIPEKFNDPIFGTVFSKLRGSNDTERRQELALRLAKLQRWIAEFEEDVLAEVGVVEQNLQDLLEPLAELEHEQWCQWIQYNHSLRKGMINYVYAQKWKKWLRLSRTPYSELSEEQKESDRMFARKVLEKLGVGVVSEQKEKQP